MWVITVNDRKRVWHRANDATIIAGRFVDVRMRCGKFVQPERIQHLSEEVPDKTSFKVCSVCRMKGAIHES